MQKYNDSAVKVQTSLAYLNFGQSAIFSLALAAVMAMVAHHITNGLFFF
jgi:ATP-binding cassette subfamily B (MDR/TAP) protein 7